MNQQDIEVAIEVLKERQRVQANHLKDVDECCGKLKGSTSQEFRILGEKIIKVEDSIDNNCSAFLGDIGALEERVKTQCETSKELKKEILEIRKTYKKVTLEIIVGVLMLMASLFIHI